MFQPDLGYVEPMALGRLTGLMGKDEVIWLRACLSACTPIAEPPEGLRGG